MNWFYLHDPGTGTPAYVEYVIVPLSRDRD